MYPYAYYYEPYNYYLRQFDLGVEWHVQEGPWTGIWRRRGNSNTFDARWTMHGAADVTAVLTMHPFGNTVYIIRQNSSDGNNCVYTGTFSHDGNTVTGTSRCNQGGGHWRATIIRRQPHFDLGRVWHVKEGPWTGVWRRRGNSHIFDGRWTMPGARDVTAVLSISLRGNTVHVQRRHSSDGNECDYIGTIAADGRTVTGTFNCKQGGGGNWSATIHF